METNQTFAHLTALSVPISPEIFRSPCQENPTGGAAICGDTTPNVSVPEPFTGLGSAMAFGLGIFLKRKQGNQQEIK